MDHAQLVPGEGIQPVARNRSAQDLFGLVEMRSIFGRDQGMAEHAGDQRLAIGQLGGAA